MPVLLLRLTWSPSYFSFYTNGDQFLSTIKLNTLDLHDRSHCGYILFSSVTYMFWVRLISILAIVFSVLISFLITILCCCRPLVGMNITWLGWSQLTRELPCLDIILSDYWPSCSCSALYHIFICCNCI